MNICVNESVGYIIINTGYEFNLGVKICISFTSSGFESGVNRAAQLVLEMLKPNADEITCSRKMRVAERFSR